MALNESDREKFVRLANKRVNKALKAIQLIGNLSNKSNYEFNDKDIEKIFTTLSTEIKNCREKFVASGPKKKNGFTLE